MYRVTIAVVIGGLILAFFGVQEFRVSMGASSEPLAIELAAIEGGETPSSNHILIGEHMADYVGCVYQYSEDRDRVNYMYYPIVSFDSSFFAELNALYKKYGNQGDIPDEVYPEIDDFRVLVKTKRFNSIRSIPNGWEAVDKIQGLVINSIDSLGKEERRWLHGGFPKVDLDKVLIIEDGRKPSSMVASLAMIGCGGLLSILAFGWLFLGPSGSVRT